MRSWRNIGAPVITISGLSEGPAAARWRHAVTPFGSRVDMEIMRQLLATPVGTPALVRGIYWMRDVDDRWISPILSGTLRRSGPAAALILDDPVHGVSREAAQYLVRVPTSPDNPVKAVVTANPKLHPLIHRSLLIHEIAESRAILRGVRNNPRAVWPTGPAHSMGLISELSSAARQGKYMVYRSPALMLRATSSVSLLVETLPTLQRLYTLGLLPRDRLLAFWRRAAEAIPAVSPFVARLTGATPPQPRAKLVQGLRLTILFSMPTKMSSLPDFATRRAAIQDIRISARWLGGPNAFAKAFAGRRDLLPNPTSLRSALDIYQAQLDAIGKEFETVMRFNRRIGAPPFPEKLRAMRVYRLVQEGAALLDLARRNLESGTRPGFAHLLANRPLNAMPTGVAARASRARLPLRRSVWPRLRMVR